MGNETDNKDGRVNISTIPSKLTTRRTINNSVVSANNHRKLRDILRMLGTRNNNNRHKPKRTVHIQMESQNRANRKMVKAKYGINKHNNIYLDKRNKQTGVDDKMTEKEEKRKRKEEEDLEMGDKFDVIKQVIKVNSPITTINPDFIMSDLSLASMTNPGSKYVRKQLSIIEAINIYLNKTGDDKAKTEINQLMLNDVYSLVNLSRADRAKVILAILRYIESGEGIAVGTNTETEPKEEGLFQKLNPFKKAKAE